MKAPIHPLLDPRNFNYTVLSTLVLGALAGAVADELKQEGLEYRHIVVGLLVLFVAMAALVPKRKGQAENLVLKSNPRPARGLIAMVSLGAGADSARHAIGYHAINLEHLWLLTTKEAKDNAAAVVADASRNYPKITVHPVEYMRNQYDLEEAILRVTELRRHAIRVQQIAPEHLMCDFTGLTRQASAGMVLACAQAEGRMQFMKPRHVNESGQGFGESDPVEVMLALPE